MLRTNVTCKFLVASLLWIIPTTLLSATPTILLQSTTSTANSGLYDYLLPAFKAEFGIQVNVVAVGTGQAINNAANGDGDVLLVHAKSAEEKFVEEGFGIERFDVMYNDFVLVGPATDPAGLAGMSSVVEALQRIALKKAIFVSRGDDSGTHKKERSLWQQTGQDVDSQSGKWYRELGSGMGATLNAASAMSAYTLTDRGTWISFKNRGSLRILLEGDKTLFNQYGIILVNPQRHNNIKHQEGQVFIDWILSKTGQKAIATYKLNGEQLFYPNAQ
ncbi:MAG: tungstate transport system substrate-binding protein [Parasphingorhabdus sp.]|jgi:tungstate transport system substrate-binding protein